MSLSVTELGQKYNVNGQVMNYILKMLGYLSGEPGDYSVTDKGSKFVYEKYHHRGTGGYSSYNRYWTTRRWDESIIDDLNITPETIQNATSALAERKKMLAQCVQVATEEAYKNQQTNNVANTAKDKNNNYLIPIIIIGGAIVVSYGLYKAAPHIKKWWQKTLLPKIRKIFNCNIEEQNLICPICKKHIVLEKDILICKDCNFSISTEDYKSHEILLFCEECHSFLNKQENFNITNSKHICSCCGYENDILIILKK